MKLPLAAPKVEGPRCLAALDFKLLQEKVGAKTALRVMHKSIARQKEEKMQKVTH